MYFGLARKFDSRIRFRSNVGSRCQDDPNTPDKFNQGVVTANLQLENRRMGLVKRLGANTWIRVLPLPPIIVMIMFGFVQNASLSLRAIALINVSPK